MDSENSTTMDPPTPPAEVMALSPSTAAAASLLDVRAGAGELFGL